MGSKLTDSRCIGALLAVLVLVWVLAPGSASAGWKSHRDELPGKESIKTELMILGGVAVAGALYLIIKSASHSNDGESTLAPSPAAEKGTSEVEPTEAGEEPNAEPETIVPGSRRHSQGVGLYLGIDDDAPGFSMEDKARDFSDVTLRVGLTIGF